MNTDWVNQRLWNTSTVHADDVFVYGQAFYSDHSRSLTCSRPVDWSSGARCSNPNKRTNRMLLMTIWKLHDPKNRENSCEFICCKTHQSSILNYHRRMHTQIIFINHQFYIPQFEIATMYCCVDDQMNHQQHNQNQSNEQTNEQYSIKAVQTFGWFDAST